MREWGGHCSWRLWSGMGVRNVHRPHTHELFCVPFYSNDFIHSNLALGMHCTLYMHRWGKCQLMDKQTNYVYIFHGYSSDLRSHINFCNDQWKSISKSRKFNKWNVASRTYTIVPIKQHRSRPKSKWFRVHVLLVVKCNLCCRRRTPARPLSILTLVRCER